MLSKRHLLSRIEIDSATGLSESIPFLVDNAKRPPMSLTPRARTVGLSRRALGDPHL